MGKICKYTNEEIEIICRNINEPPSEISKLLNRKRTTRGIASFITRHSKLIDEYCSEHKIKRLRLRTNWTDEDNEKLSDLIGKKSYKSIAKIMGRTVLAIQMRKAKTIPGKTFDNSEDIIGIQDLMITLGYSKLGGHGIESWKSKGLPIKKFELKDNSYYGVHLCEFWKWAEENQPLINFAKFEPMALGAEPKWATQKRKIDMENAIYAKPIKWSTITDNALISAVRRGKTIDWFCREYVCSASAARSRLFELKKLKQLETSEYFAPSCPLEWSEKDITYLKKNVEIGHSFAYIAAHINHPEAACKTKCDDLYGTHSACKIFHMVHNHNRKEK